jgi:hypothetical protein
MTKTKLLLTGLLAGAVAFGTACKTDKGNTNTGTGTDTTTMGTDAGTGGTGYGNPDSSPSTNPPPSEGTREMEPGVHEGDTHEEPGTGGTGMDQEPMDPSDSAGDNSLGGETGNEPLNPGAPAQQPTPNEGTMNGGDRSDDPRH